MKKRSKAFWYNLINEDGTLMGLDMVRLRKNSFIADFRKLVKVKNADLKDIPPRNLVVYQNQTAYDGKDNPLKPSDTITGGVDEENALVVVVPNPKSQGRNVVLMVEYGNAVQNIFSDCKLSFYATIPTATCEGEFLVFEEEIPSTVQKSLYIRSSYKSIAKNIEPGRNKTIITGTPGIGKSLFLVYLLWKLVKEGKRVLFIYHPDIIYYDGKGGVFECTSPPPAKDHAFWNTDLWFLFDAKSKREGHLNAYPYGRCTFVLSTSPRR
jgi:hypothetical protein